MSKREKLSKRQAQKVLDEILGSGKMVHEMDMKVVEEKFYHHPDLYIKLMEKLYNR